MSGYMKRCNVCKGKGCKECNFKGEKFQMVLSLSPRGYL